MKKFVIVDQNALDIGGHYYNYTKCIFEAALDDGFDAFVLINKRLNVDLEAKREKYIHTFMYTWGESENNGRNTWGFGNIAYDFSYTARKLSLKSGDHVLFHTVGFFELISLLKYITNTVNRDNLPYFHIIMRYDSSYMHDDISTFRPLFQSVSRSSVLSKKVLFYTDTEHLSKSYEKLTKLPIVTLPIPFNHGFISNNTRSNRDLSELKIGYFGDARLEKGYNLIPEAIEKLSLLDIKRSYRFVIQSNFNSEGGEKGIAEAREKLEKMKNVDIIYKSMNSKEYYENIMNVDAILIPYDSERYVARSSGILIEALATGKPVLTSAGSWMSSQVSDDHSVVWDKCDSLHISLGNLINNFDNLSVGAKKISQHWLGFSSAKNFVEHIISRPLSNFSDTKLKLTDELPRVLLIMNGDAMVLRNGASRVALSQIEYLSNMGFKICAIFLGYDVLSITKTQEQWYEKLSASINNFNIEAVFSSILDEESRFWWRNQSGSPSIDSDMMMHRRFVFSTDCINYIENNKIDVVLLNYITSFPVIDTLELTNLPIICEIHDIQSFQKALYGSRPVCKRDLEAEFDALTHVKHAISLNDYEASEINRRIPYLPTTVNGITPKKLASFLDSLAGCVTFKDVIENCNPDNLISNVECSINKIDILFIGSNHLPNIDGLRWFIDKVFIPYLNDIDVNLVVAGSVTDYGDWPISSKISYLGRLGDLSPLYSAARTVVLPILDGAGSPVKTIEAIIQCVPAVATRHAMRGIDPTLWDGVSVVDDPEDFARSLLKLLSDSHLRSSCRNSLKSTSKKIASPEKYKETMNDVFFKVLGDSYKNKLPTKNKSHNENECTGCDYFAEEWSETVSSINKLVIASIYKNNLELSAIETIKNNIDKNKFVQLLKKTIEVIIIDQSAFILKRDPDLLRKIIYEDADHHFNAILNAVYPTGSK